ncbi:helix-turn-helix domain-containing protein [Streptomyces hainanensis]|uniref:XRE family transcriptional regulator n=1 Tax=Streptomyces hainanensis TaxID=402648 RepID=A0A4R4T2H3_9ACTN|nr:helix-turn-helix transcriptional regulator [Streptomyces hainanensis]TDC68633.1 XRE family transcriptional regulator [Streptomyces hainanensis]
MTSGGPVPSPAVARDVGEFVAAMRTLKERSGLSLRQLGERAEARGDILPRSTLADVLNRSTLPRPDVLAAFVRACGGDEGDVREWLAARDRVAAPPPPEADGAGTPRRRRGLVPASIGLGLAVLLAAGTWALWPDGEPASDPGTPTLPFPDGEVEIRPAHAPDLCLTEGRQRSGRYGSAVAVEGPCDAADGPRTLLRAVGVDDWYFVEWDKPSEGRGCLSLMAEGPAAGLLEPVNAVNCGAGRPEQHFRLEPVTPPAGSEGPAYLLRNEQSDQCLAVADDAEAAGAEAIQGPCTGDSARGFLINAVS